MNTQIKRTGTRILKGQNEVEIADELHFAEPFLHGDHWNEDRDDHFTYTIKSVNLEYGGYNVRVSDGVAVTHVMIPKAAFKRFLRREHDRGACIVDTTGIGLEQLIGGWESGFGPFRESKNILSDKQRFEAECHRIPVDTSWMTKAQIRMIELLREQILFNDGLGHQRTTENWDIVTTYPFPGSKKRNYEYKAFEVKLVDMSPRKPEVSLITEVGRVGDEGTMAEIYARNRRHIFIGPRGGVKLANARGKGSFKSWPRGIFNVVNTPVSRVGER